MALLLSACLADAQLATKTFKRLFDKTVDSSDAPALFSLRNKLNVFSKLSDEDMDRVHSLLAKNIDKITEDMTLDQLTDYINGVDKSVNKPKMVYAAEVMKKEEESSGDSFIDDDEDDESEIDEDDMSDDEEAEEEDEAEDSDSAPKKKRKHSDISGYSVGDIFIKGANMFSPSANRVFRRLYNESGPNAEHIHAEMVKALDSETLSVDDVHFHIYNVFGRDPSALKTDASHVFFFDDKHFSKAKISSVEGKIYEVVDKSGAKWSLSKHDIFYLV